LSLLIKLKRKGFRAFWHVARHWAGEGLTNQFSAFM